MVTLVPIPNIEKISVVTELAWQCLAIQQLLIRPSFRERSHYGNPDYTVLAAPGFQYIPERDKVRSEAAVLMDPERKQILILRTAYAWGNQEGHLHRDELRTAESGRSSHALLCNPGSGYRTLICFFGLSGTGKTTLSSGTGLRLIGDDEHGRSSHSVFNLEGGCYAKCIGHEKESQPEIFHAVRFGAVAKNTDLDPSNRTVDLSSGLITENTRTAYPITRIHDAVLSGIGPVPNTVTFLTADAFGVLPPVSRFTNEGDVSFSYRIYL